MNQWQDMTLQKGHSVDEPTQVREAKREKRGGFEDGIYWIGNEE